MKPALFTIHSGELSACWYLVEDLWQAWADAHEYELVAKEIPEHSGEAQWSKLRYIRRLLEEDREVFFVDADTFPTNVCPDPRDEITDEVLIASTCGRPDQYRFHVGLACTFLRPEAAAVLELAETFTKWRTLAFPDERSLMQAMGLQLCGFHAKAQPPAPGLPTWFHTFAPHWLVNICTARIAKAPPHVWHAAGHQRKKVRLLTDWLAQGRAGQPLREDAKA